jgi:hypothetical protein
VGFFKGIVQTREANEDEILSSADGNEQPTELLYRLVSPHPTLLRRTAQRGSQPGKLQDLRAVIMTKPNKRAQAAIPHQVKRNLSCPAWFSSPRGKTSSTPFRREMKNIWRVGHGIVCIFENLRRLWLPLVPTTNTVQYLLQGVPKKAESLSDAR